MALIKLTQGKFALVDDEDYEMLNQRKWHYHRGYAVHNFCIGTIDGKTRTKQMSMHRVLNKTPEGMITDHINGNPLDNRKVNLRACSNLQNCMNRKSHTGSSSKYKGVCWNKGHKKWGAHIRVDKKLTSLGYFLDEADAALAYNFAAMKYFGEFARLNNANNMVA
jgi:hypothetical protein